MEKIHWGWVSIISAVLLAGVILGNVLSAKWISDSITFIGILASVFGLLLTLRQLQRVEEMTKETQKAVEENKNAISKIWSVEDLAALVKEIELVQHHLLDNEFHFCMLRIKDIRMKVFDMVNNKRIGMDDIICEVEKFLPVLQNDYLNIQKQIDKNKVLKKEVVSENLEKLNDLLLTIKAKLTQI